MLDIGTSICAEGKVRVSYNKGVPVPEGWLLDAAGKPTTDPAVLYHEPKGTILPLGGPQTMTSSGPKKLSEWITPPCPSSTTIRVSKPKASCRKARAALGLR